MARPRGRHGHGPQGGPPVEKVKDFKGTINTLLSYLKPFKLQIIVIFIFAMISTIFSIVSPTILGGATDIIVSGLMSGDGVDFEQLGKIILFLVGLYIVSFLFSSSQSYMMSGISQKVTYELREKMSAKIDRLPLKYYDSKTHGEIQSRFVNDIETVNQTLSQSLAQAITSATTIIGILAMMIRIDIIMTLVSLLVIPLSLILMKAVISKSQPQFKRQQESLGQLNGHIEEMFGGHQVVKAFNKEDESLEKFNKINEQLCDSSWKSQFLSGLMMPFTAFIGNIGYVIVCIIGGKLALSGRISIGDIQAFIQYVRSFNQPLSQVSQIANMLQSTAAAAERIFEFIDEEEEPDAYGTSNQEKYHIDIPSLKGQVSFNNVSFGYKEGETVINNFTYDAKPGDRIAIVGPTGAGKTTIIKLLLRYYELNGGSISIDGHNITEFSRFDLREMFGMVLQDTWLFSGTIEENIKYGNSNATKEQVIQAAKDAHIHHHIMTLPKGYDTELNESASNLSQGEKQLLTIARALLADNPILILDEATSSVDTRTEKLIQNAMLNLMENRTCFIIAHRLSTIKDADHILVMNHGDIIEQGTHNQLLAAGGFYANLYNSQFSEEQE